MNTPMTFEEILKELTAVNLKARESGSKRMAILAASWSAFKIQEVICESEATKSLRNAENQFENQ